MSVLEVSQVDHIAKQAGTTITDMKVMKSKATSWVVLILLFVVAMFAGTQSSTEDRGLAQQTQARGYWVDPSSSLMWAGKDNGSKEVNWHQAMKYCRNLRLAGYSDWRLATIDELQGIYDKSANAPGLNPKSRWHPDEAMDFHVKGGLFLTGLQWSSSQKLDDRWKPSGYAWRFDYNDGRPFDGDELWFHTSEHALCVRDSKTASSPPSSGVTTAAAQSPTESLKPEPDSQAPAYLIDPSTGLMWTAKDNGKDVNLGEALKYCRDLRAAGYSGWRLATIDELEKIHVSNVKASEPTSKQGDQPLSDRVIGKPVLTVDPWSSRPVSEDRGYPPRFVWYLNVNTGTRVFDDPSFSHNKRALCVRNSVVQHASPSGASSANAGSSLGSQGSAQETQQLGYWIDPSTGLMWAGRDNLQNFILYSEATKYCRDLRLARYSDWRLATIEELQGIYDQKAESPGANPRSYEHEPEPLFFHIKGNLFLTGMQWGSTSKNDGGNPSGYVWVFDFKDGRLVNDKGYSISEKRALCVRRSGE